jgi:hypothetical protein
VLGGDVLPSQKLSQVSQEVLKHVKEASLPPRPSELLDNLTRGQQEYNYTDYQDALSDLLEDQKIFLTPDRHLVVTTKCSK